MNLTEEQEKLLLRAIEEAKREILKKLAEDDPWLFDPENGLYHIAKKMPNGKKTFTIHVKDGFVEEVVVHTNQKTTYKK